MSTSAVQRDRSSWERLSATVRPEGRAFIAGRPVAARDGGVFDDVSPIDGQVLCQVARCRSADVDAAVAAARASFETGPWRRMEPRERKRICGALRKSSAPTSIGSRCWRRATSASRS